jgi:hypothetical protein
LVGPAELAIRYTFFAMGHRNNQSKAATKKELDNHHFSFFFYTFAFSRTPPASPLAAPRMSRSEGRARRERRLSSLPGKNASKKAFVYCIRE